MINIVNSGNTIKLSRRTETKQKCVVPQVSTKMSFAFFLKFGSELFAQHQTVRENYGSVNCFLTPWKNLFGYGSTLIENT